MSERPVLIVVSDATAETAERVLRAALVQFQDLEVETRIFSSVRTDDQLNEVFDYASGRHAMLVHTLVNPSQRQALLDVSQAQGIPVVDLIGELMGRLSSFLSETPRGVPGIPRLTEKYFRRIEAVEFAVKHDDGQAIQGLAEADIILVGLSRTSKTPLSTYLAQKGWKVANVPLVLGLPMPRKIDELDQERIFGLTIDASSLIRIRRARLRALNMPADTDYATREYIIRELEYARSVFDAHPAWPVVDVSQKAIEETASMVLRTIEERQRKRREH